MIHDSTEYKRRNDQTDNDGRGFISKCEASINEMHCFCLSVTLEKAVEQIKINL